MANQPQTLTVAPPRTYTRTDFAALRAFVQHIEPAAIARRYYDADDPQQAPYAATPEAMARYLVAMRDELVRLALLNGSSVLAEHLKTSIRKHGSARLTAVSLRMVEQAAQLAAATPAPAHGVGLWFRPLVARRLSAEGITTLGELIGYCNLHGGSWWRSVPRIGPLRARTIVAWLRRHAATLGARIDADVDVRALEPGAGQGDGPGSARGTVVVIGGPPETPRLAPFERLAVPAELSGGEGAHGTGQRGANRATAFAFIRAPHDLAAIHAYLHRYRDRPATLRAYTRELERLILWAVVVRGVAVSSMTVEDCEAYKDFLAAPSPAFTGPKRSRAGGRWRPFAPGGLAPDSQAYAVRVLRAAFTWLTEVRYLAGNPWSAVHDPVTVTREVPVQVGRALPAGLWTQLRDALDARCAGPVNGAGVEEADARQWRTARAAILLMGDSGLRRDEAAHARRENLRLSPLPTRGAQVWALTVTGKRRKQRTVPVSAATVRALREHWADRGRDFNAPLDSAPLIVPLVIPATGTARKKHGGAVEAPYTADALGHLVRQAIQRVTVGFAARPDVPKAHLVQLANTSAHAFRHTFGTRAVARDMPVDVVQAILGHASLQTTSIYVRAEQQRMLEAAAQYYAADDGQG
ncbi:UNVERIFIED_ORG: integrase [Burkholderia sp. 1595]|uniref:Integrase n=1 Tax=Paraburkholderia terricola TaxID=169427 RepID=A0ABU1M0G8_9BURK|nr:site-specific integrase [Paraburkholderia terricola]MDR6412245.1 integrase [Paraburkholderia terricola]